MDDGRVFLPAFRRGWRWEDDTLVWSKEWEDARKIKEKLFRLGSIIGCKIKTVEKTELPLSRQWEGLPQTSTICAIH